jgi:predicted alpha/beta-hydrolase family hydrolase
MLIDGPTSSRATVVLTHGAGSPMDTPFMKAIALGGPDAKTASAMDRNPR